MKKEKKEWFEIYPQHPRATDLSIASGAIRLLAMLLGIAAALMIAAVLAEGFHSASHGWHGSMLWYLVDEMDDEMGMVLVLAGASVLCGYGAYALKRKAEAMGKESSPGVVQTDEQR